MCTVCVHVCVYVFVCVCVCTVCFSVCMFTVCVCMCVCVDTIHQVVGTLPSWQTVVSVGILDLDSDSE